MNMALSYWPHLISGQLKIGSLYVAENIGPCHTPDVKGTTTSSGGPGSLILLSGLNRCLEHIQNFVLLTKQLNNILRIVGG